MPDDPGPPPDDLHPEVRVALNDEPTVEDVVRRRLRERLGGPRGALEVASPTAAFAATYVLVGQLRVALIVGLGVALLLGAVRLLTGGTTRYVRTSLLGIGMGAVLATITGRAEDVFVPTMLRRVLLLAGLGASVVVRRPALGYVVGWAIGDRHALRHDAGIRRLGTRLTLIMMLPSATQLLVEIPLYLAGEVGWLGVVRVTLGWPLTFACVGLAGAWMARGHTPLEGTG